MFYNYSIDVPANTTQSSPVVEDLKVCKGVLRKVELQFPHGCNALAHCQILHHEQQLLPSNPDGDFAASGYVIPIDEDFNLDSEPYVLKAICWNTDDTYQHTITIRIGIAKGDSALMANKLFSNLAKFLSYVGFKS